MGRFVRVYVVDFERVYAAVGSGDNELRRLVEQRCATRLARDTAFRADDDPRALSRVLRSVIAGDPADSYAHGNSGKAYELICEALSVWESSHGPYNGKWLGEVDEGLRELHIKHIGFTAFEGFWLPGRLSIDEGGYGEWSHQECVEAVEQWQSTTAEQRDALGPDVREWVELGIQFASAANGSPGHGIAGFCHI